MLGQGQGAVAMGYRAGGAGSLYTTHFIMPSRKTSCSLDGPETQQKFCPMLTSGLWLWGPDRPPHDSCRTKNDTCLSIFFFICFFFSFCKINHDPHSASVSLGSKRRAVCFGHPIITPSLRYPWPSHGSGHQNTSLSHPLPPGEYCILLYLLQLKDFCKNLNMQRAKKWDVISDTHRLNELGSP